MAGPDSRRTSERRETQSESERRRGRWFPFGRLAHRAFHLYALSGMVLAQPLFDVLGRHPEDLVAQGLDAFDIRLLTAIVTLAIPSLAVGVSELCRIRNDRLGDAAYFCFIAVFVGLFVSLAMARSVPLPSSLHLGLAIVLGFGGALLYSRLAAARQFLTLLVPLAALIPIVFLFFTPIRDLAKSEPASEIESAKHPASETPVVIVVFDELPVVSLMDDDKVVDSVLFPRFAELAETSTWFRNATTPATLTWRSLPAIVTGQYPRDGQVSTLEHHPRSLFTWFAELGYELQVAEPSTQLSPRRYLVEARSARFERLRGTLGGLGVLYLHLVLPPSLNRFLPDANAFWVRHEPDRLESFRAFVGALTPGSSQLIFLHSLLPHHPWRFLPSGRSYPVTTGSLFIEGLEPGLGAASARWSDDSWAVAQAYQQHLLQAELTDRLLGELVDRLQQLEIFDQSLLVVTADHGISFRPGGAMRMAEVANYDEIISVPLFIKFPRQQQGSIDDRSTELIDIVPTIAQVLGIEQDWQVDGRSTLASADNRRVRKLVYHTPDHKFWIDDASVEGKYSSLARKRMLFPNQHDPKAHSHLEPFHQGLLGRSLSELAVLEGSRLEGNFDGPTRYDRLNPDTAVVPVRVTGHVEREAGARHRLWLALAVNGVIRAVTLTRTADGGRYFAFMVDEEDFREGHNQLALFELTADSDRPSLMSIELPATVDYSLLFDTSERPHSIRSSDGSIFPVDSSRAVGQAADLIEKGYSYQVVFLGWAKDPSSGEKPERILVFDDERLLHVGGLNFDTALVRSAYKLPEHENEAFHYVVSRRAIRGRIRIFALFSDGVVRPVAYHQELEPRERPTVHR